VKSPASAPSIYPKWSRAEAMSPSCSCCAQSVSRPDGALNGALVGAGAGALVGGGIGAGVGASKGGGLGAAVIAPIGMAIGATVGALIGGVIGYAATGERKESTAPSSH
jgi:hypothetical protein